MTKNRASGVMKAWLIVLFFGSCTALRAFAYEPERAKTNLASDFAECISFYVISAEGLRRSDADVTLIQRADQAASAAYDFAVSLSNVDVTQARAELSMKEQRKLLMGDFSNFSILLNKYGEFCQQIIEHPEERLEYWLERR